jgi:dipeptidyl aminopeptidase/acylaminoacyl peptidase
VHHVSVRADRDRRRWGAARALTTLVLGLAICAPARADVFNGRIAFASFRTDPTMGQNPAGDVFTISPDGTGLRRLTTNPANDRQPDWSPDGRDIAYTISKPNASANFEVARMTATGQQPRQLTTTETGQASSQPSWLPDASAILFRRSGPGRVSTIWQMGPFGESPQLRFQPPYAPLYPSMSPDRRRVLFTAIMSPTGDTDRAIFAVAAGGGEPATLFDVPGAFDSGPAWSPDGTQIAFESNANVDAANPEGDMEIWKMAADGSRQTQLTHNAVHDEGPAWSPDAGLLAYTSGPDNEHGDIHVMTPEGEHQRQLTTYAGEDESPDWQTIPAPRTDKRCGNVVEVGPGAHDVRARRGVACRTALTLAARWVRAGRPKRIRRFAVAVEDFGGMRRVVLTRADRGRRKLVAFLYQSGTRTG